MVSKSGCPIINPHREAGLWTDYRLRYWDVIWLYDFQDGKCLWRDAQLPVDPLSCAVDHIGGSKGSNRRGKGLRNRNNVRGLCCPDGICNQFAGRVEKNHIQKEHWGALTAVVERMKRIFLSNHGSLPFPRNEDGTWRTEEHKGETTYGTCKDGR